MPAIILPSRTLRSLIPDPVALDARADSSSTFTAIPSTYGDLNSSPSPGVVAGIVLGAVAGFLLLLYVVYCILHGGLVLIPVRRGRATTTDGAPSTLGTSTLGTSTLGTSTYGTRSVMSFRSRRDRDRRRRAPSSRHSRSPRAETIEVRKTTTRTQRRSGVEPVIVDPPRSPSPVSTLPPPRVVPTSEISGVSSLDEIVVEEEHSRSPPRRQASRRYSPERGYRRDSYYRDEMDSERYYSQRDSPGRRASRRY
ncbi:hypothetical protein B0T10DRAFT_478056 [Thelonectria olida]|uniref:Uncharacterized protein n=1 Tax=Thelonectria olida TaxID=1576542 RepID=A0A9P9AW79_9HYPO|nr:hypothetical protein B0T10DRAFT_478056 [Thelonectria olida]